MGRGRASAFYADTYKCKKKWTFSNIVVLYIKRSAWNHWWKSKNQFCKNIEKCGSNGHKTFKNSTFWHFALFDSFFALTSEIFNILLNGFLLVHQWFQALLLNATRIRSESVFSVTMRIRIQPNNADPTGSGSTTLLSRIFTVYIWYFLCPSPWNWNVKLPRKFYRYVCSMCNIYIELLFNIDYKSGLFSLETPFDKLYHCV